jgi:hypothetical protein
MILIDYKKLKYAVFNNYNQVSIFAHYLGVTESEIESCLDDSTNKISNPLRIDNNPSLGFKIAIDKETGTFKIRMWDYADRKYRGDCLDLVGIILKLNPNFNEHFIRICYDILSNMEKYKSNTIKRTIQKTEHSTNIITIETRNITTNDLLYWGKLSLTIDELEQGNVYCVYKAYLNNECIYINNLNDPCYAYQLDKYKNQILWKLYFPLRSKEQSRFLTNNNIYPIECIHEMKRADILLLTKSRKDVLVIRKLLTFIKTNYSIQVNNLTGESVILTPEYVKTLQGIYRHQFINTDFDYTGISTGNEYKRKYGWIRFIPTIGKRNTPNLGGKDISDIVKNKGIKEGIKLIQIAYNIIESHIKSIENNEEINTFRNSKL